MGPVEFDVTYTYAEDGLEPQSGVHPIDTIRSVVPQLLKDVVIHMADGDTLTYASAEGLYAVQIKCREDKSWTPEPEADASGLGQIKGYSEACGVWD